MHRRGRRFLIVTLVCCVVTPLACRRAAGVPEDPFDREADDALVGYLRIDTSNPPGNETAGAEYLRGLLAQAGIESRLVGSNPRRQGVYARLRSGRPEKALLLLHHIDVVPAVRSEWTRPPFAGERKEGYIWGRGALDAKSLGVAHLMTLLDLKRTSAPLRRDVIFLGVPDEEMGGRQGCEALLRERPDLFDNVGYVLNEGGFNGTIVDRVSYWGIEIQQKVPLWIRLRSRGAGGHGSSPPEDGGAVSKLVRALSAVRSIPTPYRLHPDVKRYFHDAGSVREDPRGELLRTIAEPLDAARIEQMLPPSHKALLRDTITPTRISGGEAPNAIPQQATADVDIRLLPGESTAPMIERVRAAAAPHAEIEVMLAGDPSPATTTETDLYKLMTIRLQRTEPRSRVIPVVGTGTGDSRFFRARGMVAYGFTPFKVNYYDVSTVHAADERIRAAFFTAGVRVMRDIVREFCARP